MSEKRILCLEVSGECLDLRVGRDPFNETEYLCCAADIAKDWKDISKDTCKNCKKARYRGIPREQAIESIGRALCRKGICSRSSDCPKSCDMWKTEVGDWAEAALDALLEGKHEN